MARKRLVKRPSKRPGQKAKEPTVWVEMGPLWMERHPKRGGDLVVTERQNRRIVQGPRRRQARKKR